MKRPTQRDVAAKAGVSQAAVSMVLSAVEPLPMPDQTVARIRRAALELGYVPNRAAQALKTRRTMMAACIVPDITNPFYPALVRGIQSVTEGHGYDVITLNTDGREERERHFLDWARQGRVDGLIGVFFHLQARDLAPLIQQGLSVVRIEPSRKRGGDIPIDDIFVDNRAAAAAVANYLISQGHERVAMIAGKHGPQEMRVKGYRDALKAKGLEARVEIVPSFTEEGGYAATLELLRERHRPTAIFAANDLMAIGAMRALREASVAIPDEVAVVGFDDIPSAPLVTPPLTTVTQFQERMGIRAAEILLERLTGVRMGPASTHEMPFQLVLRQSA